MTDEVKQGEVDTYTDACMILNPGLLVVPSPP